MSDTPAPTTTIGSPRHRDAIPSAFIIERSAPGPHDRVRVVDELMTCNRVYCYEQTKIL